MIGYKAAYNYVCKDMNIRVGDTYSIDGELILCKNGFHYCNNAKDVLNYYAYNQRFNLFEIEDLGSDRIFDRDKVVTNKIKIVREIISPNEIKSLLGGYKFFDTSGNLIYVI